MLRDLRVRNLGVIEDLTLELGPGMTVLTGETGAGKTLVVEALQLLLGARASPSLVRSGAVEALVEARFELPDTGEGTDGELVLARSLPATGRSRAWIDGRMAPVSALNEQGSPLIDIHGQHEHQSLRNPAAQRLALDVFAGVDLAPLVAARQRVRQLDEQLEALGGDGPARAREIDVVRHQLAEITAASIGDVDEEDALMAEEERLADLGAHRDAARGALAALRGPDEPSAEGPGIGADELLAQAADQLAGRGAFLAWETRLRAVMAETADLASDLRVVLERWQDDPQRLAEVQRRRRALRELRHKYGPTLADVVTFGLDAARRLEALDSASGMAVALEAERAAAVDALGRVEAAVRAARHAAAPRLAGAVGDRLAGLAMPGARLEVVVGQRAAGEPIQLLFGANAGEPLAPIGRAASGGELARAMLALRLVAMGGPGTMVFDEVDAGVGGRAALALARALRQVAADRQVLVVTHLAQVAAFADRHVAVHKEERRGRTSTHAAVLGPADRVIEITRMLSGRPDSVTGRAHAEELLAFGGTRTASTLEDTTVV